MTTTDTGKPTTLPTYHAYAVSEAAEGKKSRWTRLGAVFAHGDGQGFNLILDVLPIHFDGRLVLRAPKIGQEAAQ